MNRTCTAVASLTAPTGPQISNKQRRENRIVSVIVKSLSAKSNLKQKSCERSSWEGTPFSAGLGWGGGVKVTLQREDRWSAVQAVSSPRGGGEARRVSHFPALCSNRLGTPFSSAEQAPEERGPHGPVSFLKCCNHALLVPMSPCPHALGDVPGKF